jgi:hypothetical protein
MARTEPALRDDTSLDHFREHGWMRVPGAFAADAAAAMRATVWRALEPSGIRRADRSTWLVERPAHLQHLKDDPVFQAVGSDRTIAAIDAVLGGHAWARPADWGAFFLLFPNGRDWEVPAQGWHIDGDYAGSLSPPWGLKVHAMFGDVEPGAGGMLILSGSHRLVHAWFQAHPPEPAARAADNRRSLRRHPYIRDLHSEDDVERRIRRFHDRPEDVDGAPLQVLENTAAAGDVILMHSLLLHAPPSAHRGAQPRFLLNKDLVVGSGQISA